MEVKIDKVKVETVLEFLDWTEKGMWTKYEHRIGEVTEKDKWYNTVNFDLMKNPLSTHELFELFLTEKL